MATRTKTIEYAVSADSTTLSGGTNRDKSIVIYIPETAPTFRSVALECYFRGDNTAATNLGVTYLGISTNGSSFTEYNLGTPVAQSGECETWWYAADTTSFFTSNWTGTSNTWYVRFRGTTLATTNHSFKLVITYDYDDSETTHIKTVRIPIESTRSLMTTSYQTIGGATAIPAVEGSYLPEDSVVVRQAFLELGGNEASLNVQTDFTLTIRIDGTNTYDVWRSEQNLQGNANYAWFALDITGEDLSSAVSLEGILSGVTSRINTLGGWLTVTYEFNATNTTTVYNSLVLGAMDTAGYMGSSADPDSWGRDIFIEEPTTITMKESGVFIGHNGTQNYTASIKVGSQSSFTDYSAVAGALTLGQFTFMHRIDSGGQNGEAFATLARGKVPYECQIYSSNTSDGWGTNGFLILNYTSGKHTDGVAAHNHSVFYFLSQCTNDNQVDKVTGKSCPIAESNYWLTGVVTESGIAADNATNHSLSFQAKRASGEGEGEGWEVIGVTTFRSDNDNTFYNGRYASRKTWKRYPDDPDPARLDIEATRDYRVDTGALSTSWYGLWVTYHTITYEVAGTVTGYSGDGSGIEVRIYRGDPVELIGVETTSAGGGYSFTWYDDTEEAYCTAREDSTRMGRSDNDTAT